MRSFSGLYIFFLVLVISCGTSNAAGSKCVVSEREALLKFKHGLIDESNKLASWTGTECCKWAGVGCDNSTGNVIKLDLSTAGLRGELGNSLSNLCHLQDLVLDYNSLSGDVSRSFMGCVSGSLRSVNLEGNGFKGGLPINLGQFKQLRHFNAFVNTLQGTLPGDIGQLKNLEYLALGSNSISGAIPASIGGLSSLRELYLNDNHFTGSIPESLGQLSNLQYLSLQNNSLSGRVSEHHFLNLKSLKRLHLSMNSITFQIDLAWTPPFQLEILELSNTRVGPQFPQWLRTQKNMAILAMSYANFSSALPSWFAEISSGIMWLDLSNNLLHGNLPELRNYFAPDPFRCIFLNSNRFQGYLPKFPSDMNMLDISNNLLQGVIPQNIDTMMPQLQFFRASNNRLGGVIPSSMCKLRSINILDLSKNQLSGTLLPCWPNVLQVLDLSYNKFIGQVPSSLGSLPGLISLHLEGNRLQGMIPEGFKNLSNLNVLDLSRNALSGALPSWIGESLSSLKVLNIHSNSFTSEIPSKICILSSLQLLNLANNKFIGKIPPCFSNFSSMIIMPGTQDVWDYGIDDAPNFPHSRYVDHTLTYIEGKEVLYSESLSSLVSIDLSRNNLSGVIPDDVTKLQQLQNLNVSRNSISGHIPPSIGNLTSLKSLDLSRNKLSGAIPSSMSNLKLLRYLDLSYNNLSGRIPRMGNQLKTSIYIGNRGLCGPPLRNCA